MSYIHFNLTALAKRLDWALHQLVGYAQSDGTISMPSHADDPEWINSYKAYNFVLTITSNGYENQL